MEEDMVVMKMRRWRRGMEEDVIEVAAVAAEVKMERDGRKK